MLVDTYTPELKFESIILVDPVLFPKMQAADLKLNLASLTAKRRDIWPSHEDADSFFKSRPAFKVWDSKVLDIYIVCIHMNYSQLFPTYNLTETRFA